MQAHVAWKALTGRGRAPATARNKAVSSGDASEGRSCGWRSLPHSPYTHPAVIDAWPTLCHFCGSMSLLRTQSRLPARAKAVLGVGAFSEHA